MKMEQTQCFETSAIKHHTPGNKTKDYTQHSVHGESLKSTINEFKTNLGSEVRAVPRLCELYPDIYLTTEEKTRKTLS
jgi:hypothetical protein